MSTPLLSYASGQVEQVPDDQVQGLISAGKAGLPKGVAVPLLDPSGKVVELPGEEAQAKLAQGYQYLGTDGAARLAQAEKYGDRPVSAFAAGAARTLTFGGSDVLATGTGAVAPETLKGLEEHNPGATTAGEVTGAIAPLLLSGGAAAPEEAAALGARGLLGGAARAATAPARAITGLGDLAAGAASDAAGGGLLGKAVGGVARGAVEAPAYHLSSKLTEAAIENKPLDAQLLASGFGGGELLGMVAGGSLEGALGLAKAAMPAARAAASMAGEMLAPLGEGLEGKLGDRLAGSVVHHGMTALLGHGLGPVGALASGALHHALSEGLVEGGVIGALMDRSAQAAAKVGGLVEGLLEEGSGKAVASSVGYLARKGEDRYQAFERHSQDLVNASVDPEHTATRMGQSTEGLLSQYAPGLEAELHATGARAAAYLASQLPQNPMPPNPLLGKTSWRPSDAALGEYEAKARAVQEPMSVLHDAKAGSLTAAAVGAVAAVYPELLEHVRSRVMQAVSERPADAPALPYARRLQLSTLMGSPLDPSLQMLPTLQKAASSSPQGGPGPQQGASGPGAGRAPKLTLASSSSTPFSGSGRERGSK